MEVVKRSGGTKKIWIISAILVVIAAVGVTGWYMLSGKTPRSAYLEAEGKNFKKYSQQLKEAYKDFYETQKPYMEGTFKKRMEFTMDIKSESEAPFGIKNAANILDVLRRSKFIIDMNNNPSSKQSQTKVALLVEKAPFLDAQAFVKDRQMGFTVPVLLPDKYFMVNLDQIDQVYDRFSVPLRPKRIAKAVDIASTVKFDEGKFGELAKDYGSLLSSYIQDRNVKYGEQVSLKINGEEKKGKQIIISLDKDETKKLVMDIAGKVNAEDALLNLTYGNYAGIAKIFDEAGFFQVYKVLEDFGFLKLNDIIKRYIDHLNVKEGPVSVKKDIKEYAEKASFPEGLKMVLVVDNSGNILDRKINTSVLEDSSRKVSLEFHSGTNDAKEDSIKKGFAEVRVAFEDSSKKNISIEWGVNTDITADSKKDSKRGKVEIKHLRKINDQEEFAIKTNLDLDSSVDEATLKRNSTTHYDIRFTGEDPKLVDRFFGDLKNESWKNNKQKTKNSNSTLTMSMEIPTLDLKNTMIQFDLKKEDRLGVDFKLPEVKDQDRIDLNQITDKDLGKVQEDMLKSFGTFYLQNKPVFDALTGN
ncbi:MAG: hypothetical protein N2484_18105 [Clostridia bacterium]|nr:hypothetical protein [Clostridia bacterium]